MGALETQARFFCGQTSTVSTGRSLRQETARQRKYTDLLYFIDAPTFLIHFINTMYFLSISQSVLGIAPNG
jgi:hypothetical protein